jgi:sialidase-1
MAEGRIVELEDGRVFLNARGGPAEKVNTQRHRVLAWSVDAGETFGAPVVSTEFEYSGNGCDSGLQRYDTTTKQGNILLLFSRPADAENGAWMTVSLSTDEGRTWARHRLIYDGPSSYSDLVVLADGTLALLSQIWQEKVIFFRKVEGDTLQVGHTSGT